jgi:hypothetical protein
LVSSADAAIIDANSCSYSEVSSKVSSASWGDTVMVPAGTCTWGSTLTLTKGISLIGAGVGNTVITASSGSLISYTPDSTTRSGDYLFEFRGFTVDGNEASGQLLDFNKHSATTPARIKIGDNRFQDHGSSPVIQTSGQYRGVIYNNVFDRVGIVIEPQGGNSPEEWESLSFSYGSADNLYFEDNEIKCSTSDSTDFPWWNEGGHAGRIAIRYNDFDDTRCTGPDEGFDIHGSQHWPGGQYGNMIFEFYGNTVSFHNGYRYINHRGSWGIFFNNIGSGTGNIQVNQYSDGCDEAVLGSDGGVASFSSEIQNTYFWNNMDGGSNERAVGNSGCGIAENSEYWNYNSGCTASSCSSGIGTGTSPPTGSCTAGVGYWVASTPTATTNPSVIQNGVFYKCTSTNNWQPYFTPYTYPHPLRAGAPSTECSDGADNDGDGATDLADGGCSSASDDDESDCGDGVCEGEESCPSCSECCTPQGDEYWIDDNGAATWQGCRSATPLSGTDACSLNTANLNVQEGDTVYLRAGSYSQYIEPSSSGTSSERITFKNYGSETVTIEDTAYGILLDGNDYITVEGINFYNLDRFMYLLNGADHNIIAYCNFDQMRGYADWAGSRIRFDSQYNWIHHCRFSGYGECPGSDRGAVLDIGEDDTSTDYSSYNLIEDNEMYHGGHHVLGIYCGNNVFRNNYIHNEAWTNGWGNRLIDLNGFEQNGKRNLLEANRFGYSDVPCDGFGASGVKISTPYNIVRKNEFFFNNLAGVQFSVTNSYHSDVNYNKVYHNSFLDNGWQLDSGGDDPGRGQVTFLQYSGFVIRYNDIKNNIFYDGPRVFSYYNTNAGYQTFAGNWDGDSQGNPGFVDATTNPGNPSDTSYPDLSLQQGSPVANQGAYLTTITSPSGSGTSFAVDDAGYFFYGWNMASEIPNANIQGDVIQLEGSAQRVRITNIDYGTNTITVNQPITWTQGQGLALPYEGSAPDPGAFELGGQAETCQGLGGDCCGSGETCQGTPLTGASDCSNCCQGTCQAGSPYPGPGDLVEAESGQLSGPMQTGSDPGASGGQYVYTPTGSDGSATYQFDIPSQGRYRIEARINSQNDGGQNSFFVGLDGFDPNNDNHYAFDTALTSGFEWDDVTMRGTGTSSPEFDPMVWDLTPGLHSFTFFGREANTWLDQLRLVSHCHRADTIVQDCCIDIDEIINFIGDWKQGLGGIAMTELMDGIELYNSGQGCP